jgi:hypothetical protein
MRHDEEGRARGYRDEADEKRNVTPSGGWHRPQVGVPLSILQGRVGRILSFRCKLEPAHDCLRFSLREEMTG